MSMSLVGKTSQDKKPSFDVWCQRELSRLLKSQVDSEQVQYLLSMELRKDVQEYLEGLLGTENRAVQNFLRDFFRRWRPPERQPDWPTSEEVGHLKPLVRAKDEELVLFTSQKPEEPPKVAPPPGFKPTSAPSRGKDHVVVVKESSATVFKETPAPPKPTKTISSSGAVGKQKNKFVPLMSAEGRSRTTVLLPGRHTCQCLGQKHSLINNCVECGRIVCSQEGSGPCAFCGALVCTPEEEEVLTRDSKKGQKFRDKFLKQFQIPEGQRALDHIQKSSEVTTGLTKAMQHKDKLLDFDQTSIKRTKVIDDEMDYFSVDSNRWLSGGEKERLRSKEDALREKRHESRRTKAVTIDFTGRKIVEDKENTNVYEERHALDALHDNTEAAHTTTSAQSGALYNPSIPIDPPKFQETAKKSKKSGGVKATAGVERSSITRLQDRTLQEMTDEGKCLSMHQPWASLLVAGIKTCEGRSWYSAHRGRLWIAATAQKPDQSEVSKLEQFYSSYHKDQHVEFPSSYPSGCLLGCVDMVDCLPQEEYREQFPKGESESLYVFVVENPRELIVKFPVKGQHKLWRLDTTVHTSAKTGLKPSNHMYSQSS
ncbi:activating signal cointegrator 1-like [Halichondria panicea]|uniref:activating signal cointegrator 1-like n=1 Tax=Halichondria panicea TaxID=6063 RepID=UPI00312B4A47